MKRLAITLLALFLCACGNTTPAAKSVDPSETKKALRRELTDARDAARNKNYDQASVHYRKAFDLTHDFEIHYEHVDVLLSDGLAEAAAREAGTYAKSHPRDLRGLALHGEALLAAKQAQAALDVAARMLGIDRDDASGRALRGRALAALGRGEEGVEDLRAAAAAPDASPTIIMAYGRALAATGRVHEAALQFRAVLKKSPDDTDAMLALAAVLRERNDLAEAKGYLERILVLAPEQAHAYFELGVVLNLMGGRFTEAERAFAMAVKYAPRNGTYWYAYGEIFRVQDKLDLAVNAYRESLLSENPHAKAAGKLGMIFVIQKQYDEAERMLSDAVKFEKGALNYLHLGAAYAGQRKYKLAISAFEKYLTLAPANDPDRKRAKDAIAELKRKL